MSRRVFCLALLACAASARAQQPAPLPVPLPADPELIVPSRTVNVRLDLRIGGTLPDVRKALAGLPAQVAEPADYLITTQRAFPQTLMAIDLRQDRHDWDTNFHPPDGRPRPEPRSFELGNLVVGDYRAGL